jgi:hypothetical protein
MYSKYCKTEIIAHIHCISFYVCLYKVYKKLPSYKMKIKTKINIFNLLTPKLSIMSLLIHTYYFYVHISIYNIHIIEPIVFPALSFTLSALEGKRALKIVLILSPYVGLFYSC